MPSLHRRSFLVALAVSALPFTSACNSELHADTDAFLSALASDDYAQFRSIASDELLADMSDAKFHDIAATYAALGPEGDRTRKSSAVTNGVRSIGYVLEHDLGEVTLTVTSKGEELDGFEFGGSGWGNAYVRRHQLALEALLGTARSGDRAAARAMVHASIPDEQLDGLLEGLRPLGPVKSIAVSDDTIPDFHVTYAEAEFDTTVRMSGKTIVQYSLRPKKTG